MVTKVILITTLVCSALLSISTQNTNGATATMIAKGSIVEVNETENMFILLVN